MSASDNRIECPNCGQDIDVNEILYHKLDDDLKKKYNDKLAQETHKLEEQQAEISQKLSAIKEQEAAIQKQIAEGINAKLGEEREQIIQQEKAKAVKEQAESIKLLQKDLDEQAVKVQELNKTKAEFAKLQREKDQLKTSLEAENEQKLNKLLDQEREKIHKTEAEKNALKVSEKDHVIQQLHEQLKEAQRKAEQGSSQIQGEVQELAIEEWLGQQFPLDTIDEIKKGATGGDCLQIVNTRQNQNCGSIYYESKRTKAFQPNWIEKFKNDIRDKNADIGVLVTEAMPQDMDRLGQREGVWVCTFEEFKGLCQVLRQSIILIDEAAASQENKGDKMEMLYTFLTSNEFRLQVEGIVEGFTQMQTDLEAEKRSLQGHWKKREKQIEKVLNNTIHMHSSIKGIAGAAIQSVPLLELSEEVDSEEETE
jgi:hypothetical protein